MLREIHTDTVDIEKQFQEKFRRQYLSERPGGYAEIEADLYAGMRIALMKQPENSTISAANPAGRHGDALPTDIPYKDIIIRACAYSAGFDTLDELREYLQQLKP